MNGLGNPTIDFPNDSKLVCTFAYDIEDSATRMVLRVREFEKYTFDSDGSIEAHPIESGDDLYDNII